MNTNAVIIMMKAPRPGDVKTRLVPPLSHEEAAELYKCFLADTFSNARKAKGVDIFASYAPLAQGDDIEGFIPEDIASFPQEGDGLGERICNSFRYLFAKGYKKVCLIGSDSPDMPGYFITESFDLLEGETRLVLGPADDGGYYLVAMNGLSNAPFINIPWSTNKVLEETIKRVKESALNFKLLNPWYDIDIPFDLPLLKDNPNAPASSAFLNSLERALY
ncbi:MAG: TIGR04282 family arsenosugar biosynthesis glycosyltransferase [Deltaproteobacteria bacterium]|nr:TIGR04282 family arsenosugar biosynthesis glycosyltransferase [Deltaproteobacteria bacterium]